MKWCGVRLAHAGITHPNVRGPKKCRLVGCRRRVVSTATQGAVAMPTGLLAADTTAPGATLRTLIRGRTERVRPQVHSGRGGGGSLVGRQSAPEVVGSAMPQSARCAWRARAPHSLINVLYPIARIYMENRWPRK